MSELRVIGGKKLFGEIEISGAKNAVLPVLGAAAAVDGKVSIYNCPDITDVHTSAEILKSIGGEVSFEEGRLDINGRGIYKGSIPKECAGKMRSSITFCGGLLGRFGEVFVGLPGGCVLGDRPVDLHLKGFRALGAEVLEKEGGFLVKGRLKGTEIYLDYPSVGATQNIMIAACFAEGKTVIINPSVEPETLDLMKFLNYCGGKAAAEGNKIVIEGVGKLHGCGYSVIPDRIEAGTYLYGGRMTGGKLTLKGITLCELGKIGEVLEKTGCELAEGIDCVTLKASERIKAVDEVVVMPYPHFPTDMQPQLTAMLSLACGRSVVKERVFNGRNRHIEGLNSMGASIKENDGFVIDGVKNLKGGKVRAYDLRGGAALVIAALAAEGESRIIGSEFIDRGYENFVEKLSSVGANIKKYG